MAHYPAVIDPFSIELDMGVNDAEKGNATADRARIDFRVLDAKMLLTEVSAGMTLYLGHSPQPMMHLVLEGDVTVQDRDVNLKASAGDVILALYGDAHVIFTQPRDQMSAITLKWPQHPAWNPTYRPRPDDADASILSFNIKLNYLHPTARAIRIFPSL